MSRRASEGTPQMEDLRREEMLTPDEVAAMLGLRGLGWGARRIAAEFGCSRTTVKRYLGLGSWTAAAGCGATPSRRWPPGYLALGRRGWHKNGALFTEATHVRDLDAAIAAIAGLERDPQASAAALAE